MPSSNDKKSSTAKSVPVEKEEQVEQVEQEEPEQTEQTEEPEQTEQAEQAESNEENEQEEKKPKSKKPKTSSSEAPKKKKKKSKTPEGNTANPLIAKRIPGGRPFSKLPQDILESRMAKLKTRIDRSKAVYDKASGFYKKYEREAGFREVEKKNKVDGGDPMVEDDDDAKDVKDVQDVQEETEETTES